MAVCSCMCVQHDCLGQLVSTETEHMHTNNIQSLAIVLELLLLNTQTVQKKLGQPGLLLVMRKVIRTLSSADKLSCSQCPSFRKEGKKEAKRQMEGEIGSNGLSSDFHEREREREQPTSSVPHFILFSWAYQQMVNPLLSKNFLKSKQTFFSELTMPLSH